MKRIFQLTAVPAFLCALTVTGYAQGNRIAEQIAKEATGKGATRKVTQTTVWMHPSHPALKTATNLPFYKLPVTQMAVTVKNDPFGNDLYTNLQRRVALTNLLNGLPQAQQTVPPTVDLPTISTAGAERQAPWAEKNLIITDILSRENPEEMKKLASQIPDLAQKVTDQDILYLALTKRWQTLEFLTEKGVNLRTVFEQPNLNRAPGIIRPADLVRNMAREYDKEGLAFLKQHEVNFNRVFTIEENARISTEEGVVYDVLQNFGYENLTVYLNRLKNSLHTLSAKQRPSSHEVITSDELNTLRTLVQYMTALDKTQFQHSAEGGLIFRVIVNDIPRRARATHSQISWDEEIGFLRELVVTYHLDVAKGLEGSDVFQNTSWLLVPDAIQRTLLDLLINEGGADINAHVLYPFLSGHADRALDPTKTLQIMLEEYHAPLSWKDQTTSPLTVYLTHNWKNPDSRVVESLVGHGAVVKAKHLSMVSEFDPESMKTKVLLYHHLQQE